MSEMEPQQAPMIQPQPTPMTWHIATDENGNIVIQIASLTGISVIFMNVDGARQVAEKLMAEVDAGPKLIVPQVGVAELGDLRNGHRRN